MDAYDEQYQDDKENAEPAVEENFSRSVQTYLLMISWNRSKKVPR